MKICLYIKWDLNSYFYGDVNVLKSMINRLEFWKTFQTINVLLIQYNVYPKTDSLNSNYLYACLKII